MRGAPLARSGWGCLLTGVVLIGAGRLLGLPELFLVGAVLVALVALCLASVLVSPPRLVVERSIHPTRAHVGTPARVQLAIVNSSGRRSPVVSIRDPVSGTPGAEVLLAPLARGERATAAYLLPTSARGLIRVGPLAVVANDPFGLSKVPRAGAGPVELTVLPHVDELAPLTDATGVDPHGGLRPAHRLDRGGEEFHALRPYVVGDDLRRVHWPSTARTDEVMVRQDELPWQGRTTVVADLRASTTTAAMLEAVISAAASVLDSAWRRRDLVRLLTTDGTDSGFGAGHAHSEAILEHLAVVRAGPDRSLGALCGRLDEGRGGALVLVVGEAPVEDLTVFLSRRAGFRTATLVRFGAPLPGDAPHPAGVRLVQVTPGTNFATAWNRAMTPAPGRRVYAR